MNRTSNDAAWKGILGAAGVAGTVIEVRALLRGDDGTLCAWIRDVFHTDTPGGRLAFTGTLLAAGYVFHRHIVKPIVKELS